MRHDFSKFTDQEMLKRYTLKQVEFLRKFNKNPTSYSSVAREEARQEIMELYGEILRRMGNKPCIQ